MPKQSENQVESEIVKWLMARDWIVDRNNVGMFYTITGEPVRIGRVGQCDWRAARRRGYLEFEAKATGKTPSKEQREYIAKRNYQGIPCTWADSLSMFERWYSLHGFCD